MGRKNRIIWMVVVMSSLVLSGCGKGVQSNSYSTDEPDNQTAVSSEAPDILGVFGTLDTSDETMSLDDFTTQTPIEELSSKDESDLHISEEEIFGGAAEDGSVSCISEKEASGNTSEDETRGYNVIELDAVKYAKSDVNVRQGPGIGYPRIGILSANDQVRVTGQADSTGWYRITYNDVIGFVSNNYLVDEKVSAEENGEQNADDNGAGAMFQAAVYQDTGNEELNQLCDDILINIVGDDMSEREKAYAVYTWVTGNIKYRGISDTGDWIAGAKTALSKRSGNCYAFYSASRALLTRLGFENIEAISYTEGHYWNMVKVDGSWWHFDTTTGWGTQRFLWTSEQLLNYTYRNLAYLWSPEGYPETP